MACEKVWTADGPGMLADLKSIAARVGVNVSIERLGDTASGSWVYVEICGSNADVTKMINSIT